MADELTYSDLKEEDAEEVVSFMAEHFYPREPLVSNAYFKNSELQNYGLCDFY